MNVTEKTDWLNDFLGSKEDFYVSSHISFNNKLDISVDFDISIRFVGNQKIGYDFLLVLLIDSDNLNTIGGNRKVDDFIDLFNKKFSKSIHIIIASKNIKNDVFFASTNLSELKKYTSQGLKDYFTNINQELTNNTGTFKEINKTINDSFQYWTRNNLSKFVAINDIDAFFINKSTVFILELKRVKEELETWLPYIDDISNYKACDTITKNLNKSFNNFRTIAYNLNNNKEVAICIIIGFDKKNKYIDLFKEISVPGDIFKKPKYFRSVKCRKPKNY